MSWQKCAGSMNRMLFATVSGAYVDANVLDDVPIAVSCNGLIAAATRDGKLSVSSEAPVPLINQLDGLELSSHSKLDGNCGVNSTTLSNVEEIYQEITSNWMDRDTLMKRRCTIGYGLNASKNSEILNDELDALRMIEMSVLNVRNKVSAEYTKGKVSDATTEDIRKKINAVVKECFEVLYLAKIEVIEIYRVWSWIARIEDSPDNNNIHMFNNAASLCIPLNRGGVWQLLTNMDPETGGVTTGILSNIPVGGKLPFTSECFVSAALGIPVYRSPERDMGVDLCGWIPKYFESLSKACDEKRKDVGCFAGQSSKNKSSHNISGVVSDRDEISNASIDTKSLDGVSTTSTSASDLMREISEEVENADSFERAAALAIFHGDIEVSVEILQKHIDFYVELKSAQEVTNEIGSSNECDDEAASSNEKKEMGTSPGSLDEYYGNDITNEYIQLLSLVAMCFAGYKSCTRGGSVGKNSKNTANSTWVVMCSRVLKQLCSHHNRSESIYLSAVCQFLLHTVAPDADIIARPSSLERYSNPNPLPSSLERFSIILEDTDLFIEDRIGFALVYLDDSQLAEYLQFVGKISISGMCVTGFTEDAISLLQTHIDNTQDIQTAGLLVGRYLSECKPNEFPGSPLVKPGAEAKSTTPASLAATNAVYDTREKYWFHEYRLLLNKWQFFIQRAVIDVEFAKKQRYYKQNATASVAPAAEAIVKQQAMPGRGGRGGRGPQKTVIPPRTMYCIPTLTSTPHVYLRCHYCSSSLPVDPLHKHVQADWLRRQRPMIECCPNCKKTLPRCYICRLRVGLLNPQLEFTRLQQAMRNKNMNSNHSGSNGNGSHAGNASAPPAHHNSIAIQNHSSSSNHNTLPDDSVLPMGKWLYFCQKCKHGGHASCIDQWFQSFGQYQCGVNGCSCFCQQ